MRLVKIGSRYFNPEQVVCLEEGTKRDGRPTTTISLTGGGHDERIRTVWGHIDKIAPVLTDDIAGELGS
jgi:hypothetical protein